MRINNSVRQTVFCRCHWHELEGFS